MMSVDTALRVIHGECGITDDLAGVRLAEKFTTKEIIKAAKARAHPDRNHGNRSRWDAVEQAERTLRRAGLL